jgi:hypothetical protein
MKANKTGNKFQYLYFSQVSDDPCRTKLQLDCDKIHHFIENVCRT